MAEIDKTFTPPLCELCGKQATVHLTVHVRQITGDDGARMRHLCSPCADRHPFDGMSIMDESAPRPYGIPELMMLAGVAFALATLTAHYFGIGDVSGFGWLQMTGMIGGAAVAILGAVFRIDILVVMGAIAIVLAAAADWLSLGALEFSRRQEAALMAAALLAVCGAVMRLKRKRTRT